MRDDRETEAQDKLIELMREMPIAMLTTTSEDGTMMSVPMAKQEAEPSAQLWFITARDTRHVRDISARPEVAVTFSSRSAWVSLHGTAAVVDDEARLTELWNTFAEAWLPGGPQDRNATLIRVDVAGGEYWDTPGGKVASLISFAKTKLTGEPYEAEHGSASL